MSRVANNATVERGLVASFEVVKSPASGTFADTEVTRVPAGRIRPLPKKTEFD
jgi:hypothetical protein